MTSEPSKEPVGSDAADTEHPAFAGRIVYTRPSPDELRFDAQEVLDIRHELSKLRGRLDELRLRYDPDGFGRIRDAQAMLTGALVALFELEQQLPRWADRQAKMLARPDVYEVREGFSAESEAEGFRRSEDLRQWRLNCRKL